MKVNIGYAWRQLIGARRTAAEHEDEEVRARAAKTAAKWADVIAGMQAGTIAVGSRTPTQAPAWVTLDVVTGGFATGAYAAAGPVTAHEQALAAREGWPASRLASNIHYLESDDARELVASGCYRIDVPEEGALLVAAWLRERGEAEKAAQLVDTIAPWFEQLRFFPTPAARPVEIGDTVRLQDVGATADALDTARRQERFEAMRDAELVWKPLRDRAIALWIETVEGDVPRVKDGAVVGGWPAKAFPAGWRAWVHALVSDCRATTAAKSRRAYQALQLVEQLARVATHPNALDERALGQVRRDIAQFVTAYGIPGTPAFLARRAAEARAVAAPLHADLRRVLVERLRREPRDAGIDIDRATASVDAEEAYRFAIPEGSPLPDYLVDKAARSWDASLDTLVEHRVIPSAEELARVLPQLTASVRASALVDEASRRLYSALYRAFRRRRGLLLLNYEHQVRFHELPWVKAMEDARRVDQPATARARQVVARASGTALRAFPHTITPNKLVTELSALAAAAAVELPLVEELAADIFMGSFTVKFAEAAKIAARLLEGSLYHRYFGIEASQIAALPVPTGKTADAFATLCERRAQPATGYGVARNGKVIEQCQILTTHNLGVLFDRLALRDSFAPHVRAAAEQCFTYVVRQLRMAGDYRQQLVRVKNTAYAWRQMVFYLSFVSNVPAFLAWARAQLAKYDAAFGARFEPVMRGLELAAAGIPSTARAFEAAGGRVLTGWSTERHWLIPQAA